MKSQLKGFVEGTTHVTTGDTMKKGDHERHKTRCFYYNSGWCNHYARKCTGSSHCDYYNDGISVTIKDEEIANLHIHQKLLVSWIQEEMKNKINYRSLEGELIVRLILKKYSLSNNDLENAKNQIIQFNNEKARLEQEIDSYNSSLKKKCILIGLLIITAPFCYAYYQSNARNSYSEVARLKKEIINNDLQERVEKYNLELEKYQKDSAFSKPDKTLQNGDRYFVRAKIEYNDKKYEKFYEMILKSIKEEKNIKAVLFLAEHFKRNNNDEQNKLNYLLLILYASYLGCADASKFLSKSLLAKNTNSKLGKKFANKINNVKY